MSDRKDDTNKEAAPQAQIQKLSIEKDTLKDPQRIASWMRSWTTLPPEKRKEMINPPTVAYNKETPSIPETNTSNASSEETTTRSKDEANSNSVPFSIPWDTFIPTDADALRSTSLFRSTYKTLQWQRDNYLVGTEYAHWRRQYRDTQPPDVQLPPDDDLPRDRSAMMGVQQLVPILADFIPSPTVRSMAVPLVTATLQYPYGALYPLARDGLVQLALGQQSVLDQVMKDQLLWVLQDPSVRHHIKSSTQGYIITRYPFSPPPTHENDTTTTNA
jgi:hypothetical protein